MRDIYHLLDFEENIYLFEANCPEEFKDIVVTNEEHCDIYDECLWYVNIVDSYEKTDDGYIFHKK